MSSTDALNAPAAKSRSVFDHPKGLYVLFGAEMWERLSYYGMRALLVLYLTKHLKYTDEDAGSLYGTYTGLVYLTPLLGGFLADRVLGQRKAVFIGGLLMALGHFAMAFEAYLYLALGLIILGNGFFKPNISTMVGELYAPDDSRRDNAYTIFYMGINTGAFIAPLICGTLGQSEKYGWHWGFGAAGVGMVLGLINFALFQRFLGSQGYPPDRVEPSERRYKPIDFAHIVLFTVIGAAFVYAAVHAAPTIASRTPKSFSSLVVFSYWTVLAVIFGAIVCWVAGAGPRPDAKPTAEMTDPVTPRAESFNHDEWQRVIVILVVAIFSILFWMGFEQAGNTLTLFAENKTDRALPAVLQNRLGMKEFPSSWYQTVNPLLIVLLAPFPLVIWSSLERAGVRVNSAAKMGLGLVCLGIGFAVMDYANRGSSVSDKAGPHWLVIFYLFATVGELCLSPIGLSLVNKLAPASIASLMMATWFLCTSIASKLAGELGSLLKHNAPNLNLFTFLIWSSIIPGVILLILNPLLKKMSHGRL